MYTLVVIDMQATFIAANNRRVRNNCKREILNAMLCGASIIFVEYVCQGPTIPGLLKLTDSYRKTFIVRKSQTDGSQEVLKTIKDHRLPKDHIKVCGVYTGCCVVETVAQLRTMLFRKFKLKVIGDACGSYSRSNHLFYLKKMSAMRNVFLE
jgi:nicotinamidase-related amidase